MIIGDLPDSGQHPNRVMAFGPDGMLYISVGATCNACNESNAEMQRFCEQRPTAKAGRSLHPVCATRSASTWTVRPANSGFRSRHRSARRRVVARRAQLEQGKQYGWPHVYGKGDIYPQSTPVGGMTRTVARPECGDGARLYRARRTDADEILQRHRFARVRDAAYTIKALLRAGALSGPIAAFGWLVRTLEADGPEPKVALNLARKRGAR